MGKTVLIGDKIDFKIKYITRDKLYNVKIARKYDNYEYLCK